MAKKVSKVTPVERIIEFNSEDFRENPSITTFSEDLISEEDWKNFAENALVLIDGWDILQYAEEYPIVKYEWKEDILKPGGPSLNSFIESITVSAASKGKRFSVGTGKISSKITDCDVVVYYTDNTGICHTVIQHDIFYFLLKKPNLVVSPEGMLIFFTDKQILATVDCNHYYWIDDDVKEKQIKDIAVCNDFCKITLTDEKAEYNYSLKFNVNIAKRQMICPEISKL